jgi:MATE family multidrug resistance protein
MAGQLVTHAWPVLVAQLLSMAMMVADTVIAGRYSTAALAGVAVGGSIGISVMLLFTGILQAVAPTVAHHVGARQPAKIASSVQQGFWLALLLAIPGVLMLQYPQPVLQLAGVHGDVAERAVEYLGAVAWGLPAMLLYRTFYALSNAIGRPRVLMAISAVATATHIPLAWSLTHGALGMPPLGGLGCGISSAVVNWLAMGCGALTMWLHPRFRSLQLFAHWGRPDWPAIGGLLRLGVPMGLSSFIDVTSFTLIALFAARLGADTVAGHRVVSNFTGLIYMVPLSLSIATMVLVGQANGARDPVRARLAVRVGLGLVVTLAIVMGAGVWLLREPLVRFSSIDPAVIGVALGLIVYLCAYQLFDGVQTLLAYALRGYKVSFIPMLLHTVCLWGIGLAGGYWLSFGDGPRIGGNPIQGFWAAIVVATLLVGVLLAILTRIVAGRAAKEADDAKARVAAP